MLSEKHNDHFDWKHKLEGLAALPGEVMDKEAAWKKLHGRLQQKPQSTKRAWYLVAACLFPALIIPFLFTNKQQVVLTTKQAVEKQQPMITPAKQKAMPLTVKAIVLAKKIKPVVIEREESGQKDETVTVIAAIPVEKNEVLPSVIPAPVIDTADAATATVATSPVKKKLAVVHLNELGSPSTQLYTAPNYSQRNFSIKLSRRKAVDHTIAAQQQEPGSFKIKLSSKN